MSTEERTSTPSAGRRGPAPRRPGEERQRMVQAEPEPQSIGVPAESTAGETRVAATPVTVQRLVALGYGVVVEPGAGASSRFSDAAYEEAGARLGDPWAAEIVLKVNGPSTEEIGRLRDGATLIALISPALDPDLVEDLAAATHHRPRHGRRAPHLPSPVAGRPQLDGEHRRIPGRRRGRARLRTLLHRPGDRRRKGATRQGPGGRRRGRRTRGDRRGPQPRCRGPRHRPPARGRRAGPLPGRRVPHGLRRRRKSAPTATPGPPPTTTTGSPSGCTRSRRPTSTSSSPPRSSRAVRHPGSSPPRTSRA